MTSPRLALCRTIVCALTALALFTLTPAAHAQWVPCDKDGNTLPSPGDWTDADGCWPMYGNLTDTGNGSQSPSGALPKNDFLYYPNPNDAGYPSPPPATYSPYAPGIAGDGDLDAYAGAEAGSSPGPDSDDPMQITSQASATRQYAWTAYFLWTGTVPPPSPASFLLETHLDAYTYGENLSAPVPSGVSATVGASDQYGESVMDSFLASPPDDSYQDGRHLVQASVSGDVATVTLTGQATGQASDTSGVYPNGNATFVGGQAIVYGGVKPDTRDMTISRIGARQVPETTLPSGQIVGQYVDANGTAHGDTVYSTETPDISYDGEGDAYIDGYTPVYNSQTFAANFAGNWASTTQYNNQMQPTTVPDVSLTWNAGGQTYPEDPSDISEDPSYYQITPNMPMDMTNTGTATEFDVTCTATDLGDNASAASKYVLMVHEPTDGWTLLRVDAPDWQAANVVSVAGTGYCYYPDSIQGTWGYAADNGGIPTALSNILSVVSNLPEKGGWGAFIAATGLVIGNLQPTNDVEAVPFVAAWGEPESTFDPMPANSTEDTMKGYKMSPKLMVQYATQLMAGAQYDSGGYVGPATETYNKFTGEVEGAGDFTLNTNQPPGSPG